MTTVCGAEALALKLPSPAYSAVIECEPAASAAVESVATPAPLSVPVPIVVAPSLNVTTPVATPVEGDCGVTVAVKVTV